MGAQLFGTLPIITHGDFKIGQSRAVQTYAAKIALPSTCATPKASAIDPCSRTPTPTCKLNCSSVYLGLMKPRKQLQLQLTTTSQNLWLRSKKISPTMGLSRAAIHRRQQTLSCLT